MKLSIVIPVYQVENTLERCIKSVTEQTFTDIEVILVDDGSPDHCPELCEEWARHDKRIRVIHKANGGLSSARNAGIDMARGDYITFVDSDDFLDINTYEQVMPLACQNDIVEYAIYWHYGSDEQQFLIFDDCLYDKMEEYWLSAQAYTHTYACNKIFRRTLFDDIRFPEGRVFEDVATLPLLLQKARTVITTHLGCYYYCMNKSGITVNASGQELLMLLENHLQAMRYWTDDIYYMHVLNTQMDVYELLSKPPILPMRRVNPFGEQLNDKQRLKAIALNLLGIKGICILNKTVHQWTKHCT